MSEAKKYRADWRHVVETEFDDAQFVGIADFDAQRLRADTAEANFNRCNGLYYECQKERDTLRSDLAGAEQRIAELVAAFTPLIKNWDDLAAGESLNVDRALAALNQKSEGGVNEKH